MVTPVVPQWFYVLTNFPGMIKYKQAVETRWKVTRKRHRGPHIKRKLWTLSVTPMRSRRHEEWEHVPARRQGDRRSHWEGLRGQNREQVGLSMLAQVPGTICFFSLKWRQKGINLSWHLPSGFLKEPGAQCGRTDNHDLCLCMSSELLTPALHRSGDFLIDILYLVTSVLLADCKSVFVAHPLSTQIFPPVNQSVQPWLNCITSHHTSIKMVRVQNAGHCGHQGTREPSGRALTCR